MVVAPGPREIGVVPRQRVVPGPAGVVPRARAAAAVPPAGAVAARPRPVVAGLPDRGPVAGPAGVRRPVRLRLPAPVAALRS